MTIRSLTFASAVLLGGLAGPIAAATVTLDSTAAAWSGVAPDAAGLKGVGTDRISWGMTTQAGQNQQSAYSFSGAASDPRGEGEEFTLGTFTHENFAISSAGPNPSVTSANLDFNVGLSFDIGGATYPETFSFDWLFSHDETWNGQTPICANGEANWTDINVNGCADHVFFDDDSKGEFTFSYAQGIVTLEILGFVPGSEFWTVENHSNTAQLMARFSVAPVPLPATGLLLLGALIGLAGLRRARNVASVRDA